MTMQLFIYGRWQIVPSTLADLYIFLSGPFHSYN